jgi:hypothetical protein
MMQSMLGIKLRSTLKKSNNQVPSPFLMCMSDAHAVSLHQYEGILIDGIYTKLSLLAVGRQMCTVTWAALMVIRLQDIWGEDVKMNNEVLRFMS